ncbi:MAG: EthD domain-containing protein [Isosphaeraceae bacterium]
MARIDVVRFLLDCASDDGMLRSFDGRNLPELLFHAKARGYPFAAADLSAVAGGLEAYVITRRMGEAIGPSSGLWRRMWGKSHLQYVVDELIRPLSKGEVERVAAPMIHQLIFARPRPGMTEAEFQRYWVEVHAVKYASKIPQIRRYMVDTRIPQAGESGDPLFSGIAEIWLANEQEQLASLETPEFLQGARADEPNWAAFWATIGLDTDAHVLLEGPALTRNPAWVKQVVLLKRREGLPLDAFRNILLNEHGPKVLGLPGLRRYLQCHARDGLYAVGESRFDAVSMAWFDDVEALNSALASPLGLSLAEAESAFIETKYRFPMVAREHWIIGPDAR